MLSITISLSFMVMLYHLKYDKASLKFYTFCFLTDKEKYSSDVVSFVVESLET